jgi:hypothetical protein
MLREFMLRICVLAVLIPLTLIAWGFWTRMLWEFFYAGFKAGGSVWKLV